MHEIEERIDRLLCIIVVYTALSKIISQKIIAGLKSVISDTVS